LKTIGFYIIIWQMSTFEHLSQSQNPGKPSFLQKMRHFWLKYGEKVILAVAIVLIALFSFEAGFLKGQKNQKTPVEVNQLACAPCPRGESSTTGANQNLEQNNQYKTATDQPNLENQKCAFVASKNSNKYHLSTCQLAAKIKPENKICFSSAEEALGRGYQAAKCCVK